MLAKTARKLVVNDGLFVALIEKDVTSDKEERTINERNLDTMVTLCRLSLCGVERVDCVMCVNWQSRTNVIGRITMRGNSLRR